MQTRSLKSDSLHSGFTTGTAATAAAVANLLYQQHGKIPTSVQVDLPNGVLDIKISVQNDKIGVKKDSGDDPDVTNGVFIHADVVVIDDERIIIDGGIGIGRVTRPGLSVEIGKAAINPVPCAMIKNNIRKHLPTGGARIIIHACDGDTLAKRTFNERLGIVGGISIIGTTGIIEPMSSPAFIAAIKVEIDVLHAESNKMIWLVPGKIGENALKKLYYDINIVQMSNFVGDALEYLATLGYKNIGIAGHPGKLAKIAMGYYNTHSTNSPQATDYIMHLFGLDHPMNTVEDVCTISNMAKFNELAQIISDKIRADFKFNKTSVRLFNMKTELIGGFYE